MPWQLVGQLGRWMVLFWAEPLPLPAACQLLVQCCEAWALCCRRQPGTQLHAEPFDQEHRGRQWAVTW